MKISVFTPSHNPEFLLDCYYSLKKQTFKKWEWIILINGNVKIVDLNKEIREDKRVKINHVYSVKGVGDAKFQACELTTGDILLELDHDDILTADCLEKVAKAFEENPNVACVYSNFSQINKNNTPNVDMFDPRHGWQYKIFEYEGIIYNECICFDTKVSPQTMAFIWYMPNHVRAFRKTFYDEIGGYNRDLDVLDDQDLMCRLYKAGDFFHIDKCLYFQRVHNEQTQKRQDLNQKIQNLTIELYSKYFNDICLTWSARHQLLSLDFGGGYNKPNYYVSVDIHNGDITADLNKKFPFEDNSVGVIRCSDFLEHIQDKIHIMNEIHRVLKHGGILLSMTPSTDGRGAFQDPTHIAYWNENSFWYYTNQELRKYVPEITAKFQISTLNTHYPSQWHRENFICYVNANLIALKDETRIAGLKLV